MSTLQITLPDSLRAFVDAQVDAGTFETPTAFFEQSVREVQARHEDEIHALILEAIDSGEPNIVMTPEYWDEMRKMISDRFETSESAVD